MQEVVWAFRSEDCSFALFIFTRGWLLSVWSGVGNDQRLARGVLYTANEIRRKQKGGQKGERERDIRVASLSDHPRAAQEAASQGEIHF